MHLLQIQNQFYPPALALRFAHRFRIFVPLGQVNLSGVSTGKYRARLKQQTLNLKAMNTLSENCNRQASLGLRIYVER